MPNCNKVILDTNILLDDYNCLSKYESIVLPIQVIEEIDNLVRDNYIGYQARQARKAIESCKNIEFITTDKYDIPIGWDKDKIDNKIIMAAKENGCKVISNDLGVRIKCDSIGVENEKYNINSDEVYKGFKEIVLSPRELAHFYENKSNYFDLNINEYVLFKLDSDPDVVVDKLKWTSDGFKQVIRKSLKSMMFGSISPKDTYQECAIDSLLTDEFTILTGSAGSGKTYFSLAYVMQALQNNKIDKVVIAHNPVPLAHSQALGFYPGSRVEKLLSTSIGGILSSKFGDPMIIDTLINQGKLLLIPMADIRGVEVGENSCIYVSEAQNMDSYLVKTLIQRAKEGCKILLEGDSLQTDMTRYCTSTDNGLRRAIEVFKGTSKFSCVELQKIYRSPLAEIAERM